MYCVETYHGFLILMELSEASSSWTCIVAFERLDGDLTKPTPIGFDKTVRKSDDSALNLSMDMLAKAEERINYWYKNGNN
ncbi:hypothetical protein B0G77_3695 [Paraburkholderia sp. BL10I2N1]|nr:hypothetical protein B0G77_3695 [Paraburkholderia sp. BL10I2N1]